MGLRFLFILLFLSGSISASAQQCVDIFSLGFSSSFGFEPPSFFENSNLQIHQVTAELMSNHEMLTVLLTDRSHQAILKTSVDNYKAVAERAKKSKVNSQTVFYPSSGYDAAAAFIMFPEARTVIGMDLHPFLIEPSRVIKSFSAIDDNPMYTYFDLLHVYLHDVGVAPAVLGRLQMSLPGFRLRQIGTAMAEADALTGWPNRQDGLILEPRWKGTSHGWVEFDTGPGTPLRRYIHIHSFLPLHQNHPWLDKLLAQNLDGLLIKGVQYIYSDTQMKTLDPILSHITAKNSWVLDTDRATDHFLTEKPYDDSLPLRGSLSRTNYTIQLTNIPLGYDSMRLIRFRE